MSLTNTATVVTVDKDAAREALRAYRNAKAPVTDEDRQIMTAYREIARGRVVVQAIESVRSAGWNVDGSSKLAIIRADIRHCRGNFGSTVCSFTASRSRNWRGHLRIDRMPPRPPNANVWTADAMVPLIPLHLRPKAALHNYHILWEADWVRAPADPLLLRRLKGDLWLVLAAWELTAVERAVLEQRING